MVHAIQAREEFYRAKRKAFWRAIGSWITGETNELLPFDEVRNRLPFEGQHYLGLQAVPPEKIVGSVGRYRDFDRAFLPRKDKTQHRWQSIDEAVEAGVALPPIELYKIGDAYFVKDGNHRVSVARAHNFAYIDAYVTEIEVPVDVTPETDIDDVIREQEYAAFLHQTDIDEIRPNVDIHLTLPGQYEKLLEHIAVHRWYMGVERDAPVPYEDAVASWVDNVYLPLVEIIREQGVLEDFPERTEGDLYIWVSEHRAELEEALGWPVDARSVASHLAERHGKRREGVMQWLQENVLNRILPGDLEQGPEPGRWREERVVSRGADRRLFIDTLVALNGQESGWNALSLALDVARREHGYVHGVHVVPETEDSAEEGEAPKTSPDVREVLDTFEWLRAEAHIPGDCAVVEGEVVPVVTERARWVDLLVASLSYPPGEEPLEKFGSGFRNLLYRAPCPVLVVPEGSASPLDNLLLAYDGSPKAGEALFIAGHLSEQWDVPLVVVTATNNGKQETGVLEDALDYLTQVGVEVNGVALAGTAGEAILRAAVAYESNLIIMGSYGFNPLLEVLLSSAVDTVLRRARQPILICR